MDTQCPASEWLLQLRLTWPVVLLSSLIVSSFPQGAQPIRPAKRQNWEAGALRSSSHDGIHKQYSVSRTELNGSFFGNVNGQKLLRCHDFNPYLNINVYPAQPLADVQEVTVTVSGVLSPLISDWIAVLSPSSVNHTDCHGVKQLYWETGDTAKLPLLCRYPLKFQFMYKDPEYLPCVKRQCQKRSGNMCLLSTCNGTMTTRLINIRTEIMFVFFGGGLDFPCLLATSETLRFANPDSPLYGHLSIADTTPNAMRLTWVSGNEHTQYVRYADREIVPSTVTTFKQSDLCDAFSNPAVDFGWHNPGYIHSAILTGLSPASFYVYQYGSDSVGWTTQTEFHTPPSAGSKELKFLAYGDMGKAERDGFGEHYVQPGSLEVIAAIEKEVHARNVDAIFHIGDISYATGFLAEWDFFLEMISPVASQVPYMTAVGNHERDFPGSGSLYEGPDSGGECGVPYETYFQMPDQGKDKPWYSVELGPVHFTIMSTEHPWDASTEQHEWIQADLDGVDRSRTPWVVFAGHRPPYSSVHQGFPLRTLLPAVDTDFRPNIEPLLMSHKVDLAIWGHVHNYERTCALHDNRCKLLPVKNTRGVDIYSSTEYAAPVHVIAGMSGFSLDNFSTNAQNWSLVRISEYGYTKVVATTKELHLQLILSGNATVADEFVISKHS